MSVGRILVVDDEADVRKSVRMTLTKVLPQGGPEALWCDLGGGMGTHRASGDVKAGTD